MSLFEDAKNHHASLYQEQNKWVANWKDLRDYFAPMRGFFDGQIANDGNTFDQKRIVNDTGVRSLRDMAAGLSAGMTAPTQKWFALSLENKKLMKIKKVKQWMKAVEDILYSTFRKANLYASLDLLYLEFGGFGTGAMLILEDPENGISIRNYTIGEYAFGINKKGKVNELARKFDLTVKQLVDEFGINNVSPTVQTLYKENKLTQNIKVHYLIMPNDNNISNQSRSNKNMPFISLYWEATSDGTKFLRESGFEEFPVIAPRWSVKNSTSIYGIGPGWYSLGDTRMLQKMERDKLMANAKQVDPPMMVDSTVGGKFNRLPGGTTLFDSTFGPDAGAKQAYQVNLRTTDLEVSIEKVERRIERSFYVDLFLLLTQSRTNTKTATEVDALSNEKRILGPVLERMDNEILTPLIVRTMNIMARLGKLPPQPEEIINQEFNIEYVSILAKAQKAAQTGTVEQFIDFISIAANLSPEVLDTVDFDKAIETYGDMLGVPPDIIRDAAEIFALRQSRQQQQQAAAQAEQVAGAIEGAKTLSETEIGGMNALDKIAETTGANI